MGVHKVNEVDQVVTGQQVQYTDRDAQLNIQAQGVQLQPIEQEHKQELREEQLELPFFPPLEVPARNPKEERVRPKTRAELDAQYDELFFNFRTVLTGKDVSRDHKNTIVETLLNNYKTGNPYVSNRSKSLLVELILRGL